MEKKIPLKTLDEKLVLEVYTYLTKYSGDVSISAVMRELIKRGVYNQYTGKPFTHQAIGNCLHSIPGVLPRRTPGAEFEHPFICYNPMYPNISDWLHAKYPKLPMIGYRTVTLKDSFHQTIYGAPPIGCMLVAKCVYWLYYDRKPVVLDVVPTEEYYLRKLRCTTRNMNPLD